MKLRDANAARQSEWDLDGKITISYRAVELAGEVGELCNLIKKLERERLGLRGSRTTKQDVADELADIVICTDLLAMDLGIDLEEAIVRKFNATSEKYNLTTRLMTKEDPKAAPPKFFTEAEWRRLSLSARNKWWDETDYGKKPPSKELIKIVREELGL